MKLAAEAGGIYLSEWLVAVTMVGMFFVVMAVVVVVIVRTMAVSVMVVGAVAVVAVVLVEFLGNLSPHLLGHAGLDHHVGFV